MDLIRREGARERYFMDLERLRISKRALQVESILLATCILLAPATIKFGKMVHSAEAELSAQHLQYDIRE